MFVIIIVVLALTLMVFFGGHWWLYLSLTHFFLLTNHAAKTLLGVTLVLLSLSFFVATVLAHWYDDIVTRSFYLISATWWGIFLNLLLATALMWIILGMGSWTGTSVSLPLLAGVIYLIAGAYSVYGVWNGFHPEIKTVSVHIKNLPTKWHNKTIIQLSDIHLGHIYRPDFLEKVVAQTKALHPDMIVITGDLFDGMDGNLGMFVPVLQELQAPDGVFFVTGNHETYLGVDRAFELLKDTHVTVLNNEARNIDGLQLVGISYPERGQSTDLAGAFRALKNFSPAAPTVLLYHSPVHIEEAKANGVNLQLSGHTHKGQLFPLNFITKLVYKGYDYGLHTEGDYSIYTSSGVGTWGPPMRTGNIPEIVKIQLQ